MPVAGTIPWGALEPDDAQWFILAAATFDPAAAHALMRREAALDPICRYELEGRLDSFGDGPHLMDVTRLRKALVL